MRNLILLLFVGHFAIIQSSDITPFNLKCEYLKNPLSVDSANPRLSWNLKANEQEKQNLTQSAYQIVVASNQENLENDVGDLWDTGKVSSDQNTHIRYEGNQLTPGQVAYWKVKVWDQDDKMSDYVSEGSFFGKGLQTGDWTANWIGAPTDTQANALVDLQEEDAKLIQEKPGLVPVLYLRKRFQTTRDIKSAKLYATALGAYMIKLNGIDFQNEILAPGWTAFDQTIEYQTFDVTEHIQEDNVVAVQLGTGWYSGYIGFAGDFGHYAKEQSFLMELRIEHDDGSREVITTDGTWKVTTGPLIYSDLLHGELFYEDRQLQGWESLNYDDGNWLDVIVKPIDQNVELGAQIAQPIQITETLDPKAMWQSSPGVWVVDFEQNFVGWVQIKIRGNARVQIRHAEVINPDGSIYTANLRSARATDTYVIQSKNFDSYVVLNRNFSLTTRNLYSQVKKSL